MVRQDAIQKDLDKLEEWIHSNLMRFNKTKCEVLDLGWSKPWFQHSLWDEQMENNPRQKDLEVLVEERLDMTQPRALTAQKAKYVLGSIQSTVGSRAWEGILPLCSALLRPTCRAASALGSQHRKDMDMLGKVQRRPPS
ncbi:hypothetical protein HGM15179_017594 [Zosterops borbonicus]|uniref:Rna-directed dna polymerase from mobile element jockey-like n=1 Tax=Zosterops borbonicus TaxID=364589 RepID=A0A8K1LD67_9PASS|nr:hypothetical protein HGM15179_017594 [Zosterops borbonicus]